MSETTTNSEVELTPEEIGMILDQLEETVADIENSVYDFFYWYYSLPWWKRVLRAIFNVDLSEGYDG